MLEATGYLRYGFEGMSIERTSPKLFRKIAKAIEDEIRGGLYAAGDRLPPERELTERFGVSRPTVREALIALELLDLVETRKGSGVYVREAGKAIAQVDQLGAFELTEARVVFEGEVAAIAATSVTPEVVAELEEMVGIMAAKSVDLEKAERADRRFHILLAEATGNGAMVRTVTDLWDERYRSDLARATHRQSQDAGAWPRANDHRLILDAVAAGNPAGARLAMRLHLANVIDALLAATESEQIAHVRRSAAERRNRAAKRFSS